MYIRTTNRGIAKILNALKIGGLSIVWEYKIAYCFNGNYGEMWVAADDDDQAINSCQRKLLRRYDDVFWTFHGRVVTMRRVWSW